MGTPQEEVIHLQVESKRYLDDMTCLSLMHLDGVDYMLDDGDKRAVLRVCLDKVDAVKSRVAGLGLQIIGEERKDRFGELKLK